MKEFVLYKMKYNNVALGGASFSLRASPSAARTGERGGEKPRGRGLGQRNIKKILP